MKHGDCVSRRRRHRRRAIQIRASGAPSAAVRRTKARVCRAPPARFRVKVHRDRCSGMRDTRQGSEVPWSEWRGLRRGPQLGSMEGRCDLRAAARRRCAERRSACAARSRGVGRRFPEGMLVENFSQRKSRFGPPPKFLGHQDFPAEYQMVHSVTRRRCRRRPIRRAASRSLAASHSLENVYETVQRDIATVADGSPRERDLDQAAAVRRRHRHRSQQHGCVARRLHALRLSRAARLPLASATASAPTTVRLRPVRRRRCEPLTVFRQSQLVSRRRSSLTPTLPTCRPESTRRTRTRPARTRRGGRGYRRAPLAANYVACACRPATPRGGAHLRRGRRRPVLRRRRAVRRRAGARALDRRRPPRLAHRLPAERRRRRRRGPRRRLRRRRDACRCGARRRAAARSAAARRARMRYSRASRRRTARPPTVMPRRPPLPRVRLGVVGHLARPPPARSSCTTTAWATATRARWSSSRAACRRTGVAPERQDLGHAQPRHLAHPRGRPATQRRRARRARRRLRRVHVGRRRRLRALLRRDGHALRGTDPATASSRRATPPPAASPRAAAAAAAAAAAHPHPPTPAPAPPPQFDAVDTSPLYAADGTSSADALPRLSLDVREPCGVGGRAAATETRRRRPPAPGPPAASLSPRHPAMHAPLTAPATPSARATTGCSRRRTISRRRSRAGRRPRVPAPPPPLSPPPPSPSPLPSLLPTPPPVVVETSPSPESPPPSPATPAPSPTPSPPPPDMCEAAVTLDIASSCAPPCSTPRGGRAG